MLFFVSLDKPFEGRFNLKGLSKETKNNIYKKLNRTRVCSTFKGKDDQGFPNDFLMWSHYANSHKGCCFEFTLTNQYNNGWTTKDIIYGVHMPAPKDDSDNSIYDILSHKTPDWKNENEVRAIKIYEEGKEGNSHFYHIKLRAVYFGLSADSKNTDILVRIINALNPNISKLVDQINESNQYIRHLVEVKSKSDSLNMVLTNNLTRSLSREELMKYTDLVLLG